MTTNADSTPRALRTALTLALLAFAASAATASPPTVGETLPDLSLPTLAGSECVLSERTGPTVLVFFRGAW